MIDCVSYIISVLSLTTIWVYLAREWSLQNLALAMFFPTLLLPIFVPEYMAFLETISGINWIFNTILFSFVAVVVVYAIVYGCVGLNLILSWAQKVPGSNTEQAIHEHNSNKIMVFLRAAGEEIGWRCFLLPCLLSNYDTPVAFLVSGIVWGLFHVPVMILLTYKLKVPGQFRTILVQSLACVLMAFPIGWLAVKSKYSLLPASIMHWWWNRVNPTVLGSIYTNTPGYYHGDQWKINGEGLAGCLVMLPVAIFCLYDLYLT